MSVFRADFRDTDEPIHRWDYEDHGPPFPPEPKQMQAVNDPYKGRQSEIEDWMESEAQNALSDDGYDALSLAADACSFFGLFEPDPHGSASINIPVPILEYALKLLPEE